MSDSELHRAAEQGDRKLFQKLLDAGADVNAYDERGFTPLLSAVASAETDADFIRFLLGKGADYRLVHRGKYSDKHHALSYAIARGDLDKARAILDAGADIRYVREAGCDALIDAATSASGLSRGGDKEAARLASLLDFLLDKGVAPSGRTRKGHTALTILSDWVALDGVQRLLRAGADEAQLKWTALHRAVAFGIAKDVAARLEMKDLLDPKDHAGRTPLVLAVQLGDIKKVALLWKRGADRKAKWRRSFSMLDLAISNGRTQLVQWLVANGADVNEESFASTPLMKAAREGRPGLVKVLLAAGADIHRKGEHGSSALGEARDLPMLRLLLDAGADTGMLSNEGRRVLMGLPAEPDSGLLTASPQEYARAKHPREGRSNPEEAREAFWSAMIRSGVSASQGKSKYGDEASPIWCAQRFGQSLTFLPDGRIVLIGGEHEDAYMPDFHIYNDAFVLRPGKTPAIFLYPEREFPPTDGHSATLVGQYIYIIGNVGYKGDRRAGFTPVYRLDTRTMRIEAVTTSGEGPGWIGRHRAKLTGSQIELAGGEIHAPRLGKGSFQKNDRVFRLDLRTMAWRSAQ